MPTDINEIARYLFDEELKFNIDNERGLVATGYATKNYKNKEGKNNLLIFIVPEEDGEYLKVFAPQAFEVSKDKLQLFALACGMVQWKTKLIQFEIDETDGEVRPIIEFPLEDADLTSRQLMRCISGLVHIIDEYYHVLDRVLQKGIIDFGEGDKKDDNRLNDLLEALPTELLEEILKRKKG